jgi:hypothetical protein
MWPSDVCDVTQRSARARVSLNTHCCRVNTACLYDGVQVHLYSTGCRLVSRMLLSMGMKSSFHRRLRPIAPGFSYGFSSGPTGTLAGTATNPLASRKMATELDRCCTGVPCGLAAAHFRSGIAVMPDQGEAAQSEPARRDLSRNLGASRVSAE